jgi:hypothetical protein
MRLGLSVLTLLLLLPARAAAEWQIKPFFGFTFGGQTTLVDPENGAKGPNVVFGVTGLLLGDVIGIDADFGYARGFFQSGTQSLVVGSSATTLTGNLVVALPRRVTQYTLRPYVVGGAGLMHASIEEGIGGGLNVSSTLPAMDVGGGLTGFLSNRIGLNWDIRYFWSIGKGENVGLSFGPEQLSFWRANMAIAIRY